MTTQKVALVCTTDRLKKSRLTERTDRAWFSRLVYDIRPGNGAGLFLQPRSSHGVNFNNVGQLVAVGTARQRTLLSP